MWYKSAFYFILLTFNQVKSIHMKQIRRAGTEDAESITDLRVTEYKRSRDFTLLRPETLFWNETDDTETVLSIWDKKRPGHCHHAHGLRDKPPTGRNNDEIRSAGQG